MRIGVFDSGLGGLSTWLACTRYLPDAEYFFFADTVNAPYGDRSAVEVQAFTEDAYRRFLQLDVDALVIACNTATSAAAAPLRQYASMPIIGIEPAIKVALQESRGEVLLLATELTVRGAKLDKLLQLCDPERRVRALACPGWMEIIEGQQADWRERASEYWQEKIAAHARNATALVLGCTHYCWLRDEISVWSAGNAIFDGNDGVARQLYRLLLRREPPAAASHTDLLTLHFAASADADQKMAAAQRLLQGAGVRARILPF
ncbi:glutamate racemase [Acidithiobacillus sp. AMEEHan]|uniref:glutamate racemase n=1 Tax=Acidithiobacillus sp. AMEEHan TaxID=2994951 RepID=UPI0027E3DD41|nr:glutamate racemase [Acidithiobacillus sp. AMEEHan]